MEYINPPNQKFGGFFVVWVDLARNFSKFLDEFAKETPSALALGACQLVDGG